MKRRLKKYLSGLIATVLLLLSVSSTYGLIQSIAMPDMGTQMPPSQCQTSCLTQSSNRPWIFNSIDQLKKEVEPRPQPPYYLAFIDVGWTTVIVVAVQFLLRYLLWRPPDLIKLNAQYRF